MGFPEASTKLVTNKSRSFLERIYNPITAMGLADMLRHYVLLVPEVS